MAETIVIGGGAMGVATALALARREQNVLVLEQFTIGHELGSSHGSSRILRFAYFEHPDYARLALAAEPKWREIEQQSGESLLLRCGGLDMGPAEGPLVSGSLRACRELRLSHEFLDRRSLKKRFPFQHNADVSGVYQPDACIIAASSGVKAMAKLARDAGAVIRENAVVLSIVPDVNCVRVVVGNETLSASRVIVSAGGWTDRLLKSLGLPLRVLRKVLIYLEPPDARKFDPVRFPIFIYQVNENYYYGIGTFGHGGVKIGDHAGGDEVNPSTVDRSIRGDEERHIRDFLATHLPQLNTRCLEHQTCLYTMTPDGDFILDVHPDHPNVFIAAGFSGHGFKFAPVFGGALADLAIDGKTDVPIDRFRIARFL